MAHSCFAQVLASQTHRDFKLRNKMTKKLQSFCFLSSTREKCAPPYTSPDLEVIDYGSLYSNTYDQQRQRT